MSPRSQVVKASLLKRATAGSNPAGDSIDAHVVERDTHQLCKLTADRLCRFESCRGHYVLGSQKRGLNETWLKYKENPPAHQLSPCEKENRRIFKMKLLHNYGFFGQKMQ